MNSSLLTGSTAALLLAPLALCAQQTDSLNRFTLGARLQFNISAKFENVGGFPAQNDPGPSTGIGLNHNYDDGYVRRDSEASTGFTWYWGYRDAAQAHGTEYVEMHSSSAAAVGSSREFADAPQLGFEVAWLRELGRTPGGLSWGFKLAFNYTDISISDNRPIGTPVQRLSDKYSLGGFTAPGDPSLPGWQYQGAYDIPGMVIDDVPYARTSDTIPNGALTAGSRSISADVFGWKLGPWLELPLTKRLSLHGGAGVALAVESSTFRFNETTSIAGVGMVNQRGSGSATEAIVGAYAEIGLQFSLTQHWGLFVSGEFQNLDSFSQTVGGHKATLDLGETYSVLTGLSFSF